MLQTAPQPDQEPQRWDDHVFVYEDVFEPFTLQFAQAAIAGLGLSAGQTVLDVGAGCGGAALAMAERGLRVTAVDASAGMVERVQARAAERGLSIDARVMDGQARDAACLDQHVQSLFRHEATGKGEIAALSRIDRIGRGGDGAFVDADPITRDARLRMEPVAAEIGQDDEARDMAIEVTPLRDGMAQGEGGALGQAVAAVAQQRMMRPMVRAAGADARAVMVGGDGAGDAEIIAAMDDRNADARGKFEQPGGYERV